LWAEFSENGFARMKAAFQAAEYSGFSGKTGNRPGAAACLPLNEEPFRDDFRARDLSEEILKPYEQRPIFCIGRSALFAGDVGFRADRAGCPAVDRGAFPVKYGKQPRAAACLRREPARIKSAGMINRVSVKQLFGDLRW
jgi:hypothetical protein